MPYNSTRSTEHAAQVVDPRWIAAWLDGYDTGEQVGGSLASPAARALWQAGYEAGRAAGFNQGWRAADHAASEKHRAYLDLAKQRRGPGNRPYPFRPAKPLPSYTECLASWGLGDEHRLAHPATVRAAA